MIMKLSVIIPVYNEEKTIKQVLDSLFALALPCQKEIIVVDDGSTDNTKSQILTSKPQNHKLKLKILCHKYNQGKGEALKTGIKKATGDYILIQDADLEYNPAEITALLQPILRGHSKSPYKHEIKAVYGSRFINKHITIPFLYLLGNNFLTFFTNFLYGTKLTDMETGYKLLPASFLKNTQLLNKRFDIEPEITVNLIKSCIPITEVPISYRGRTHMAGKKLTLKDAFGAVKTLLYFKFKNT